MSTEQAALALAEEHGLPVFPCRATDELVSGKIYKAKTPYTAHGFKDASRNIEQIAEWFSTWKQALVAVPTGKASSLLVVDIDPEGASWYRDNLDRLSCGRIHKTQRGHHLLYRMPDADIRNSASKIAPGVDVRAEGGYAIWWPAHGLEAIGSLEELTEPPAWLLALLMQGEPPKANGASSNATTTIGAGQRNDFLTREAGKLRRVGLSAEVIAAALTRINVERCAPPLEAHEVEAIARSVARYEPTAEEAPAPRIELLAFTAAEIMAPIPPEQFLLPGVPAEAYTLIAGALSSFKTTLLLYLLVWKATGWDILGLDEHGYGIDTGRCVLASYEDTDRRILAKLQQVIQSGHRHICERFTRRDADEFIERAAAHIRRVPLMGKADCGIVRRSAGMIIPNAGMIERFLEEVQKFAPQGALIGLDPLRLAICGSQSDDDGADIAVHTLNAVATRIRGSGLIVCSHATKAGAQEPGNGYASAAYATSGSALFSQHARSNYLMARLKEAEVHDLFDLAQATAQEAQKQLVVRLTHGRLSHGAEQCDVYLLMRAGILERIAPRASQGAADVMRAAAGPLIGAIDRIKDSGLRVSADALGKDGLLAKAIGGRDKIRDALTLLRENGYIETTGTTTDRAIVVTEKGRASFAAPLGESRPEVT